MQLIIVFASGLVFGLGLIISGMSNPQNVIQFLDIKEKNRHAVCSRRRGNISISSTEDSLRTV
jgi:hypothetical protein